MVKIIAFYLPQFHEIPENNEWWGKGFTEWINVKKAKPLFDGHNQPRIPLNNNYYNLLDDDIKKWQIKIAKDNGIYGFCMYHYWFNGHLLLEKPIEQYLKNKSLDFPFCLCWANENWTTQWVDSNSKILIEQKYGDKKEWERHFNYFLPFFKDERYIKENNSPLLVIYRPEIIDNFNEMAEYWNELAKLNGFKGIIIANQAADPRKIPELDAHIDYHIEYQPGFAQKEKQGNKHKKLRLAARKIKKILKVLFPSKEWSDFNFTKIDFKLDYDEIWNEILNHCPFNEKSVAGAFVDFDNTPRKGERGYLYYNASPKKFETYFKKLVTKVEQEYKNKYIFMFAWNEWGEGGYLEPDKTNGYAYLNAIKRVLDEASLRSEN